MKKKQQILDALRNYFEKNGWPLGLYNTKLCDRAKIKDDQASPENSIVEIKRDRTALGSKYVPGAGMSCYQIYYMQYRVNLDSRKVEELNEQSGPVCLVDMAGLVTDHLDSDSFYLSIEEVDENQFRVYDYASKLEAIVSTIDEAKNELIPQLADQFLNHFTLFLKDTDIETTKQAEYLIEYRKELHNQLIEKFDEAWNDYI